jgi:hypothetical protein
MVIKEKCEQFPIRIFKLINFQIFKLILEFFLPVFLLDFACFLI